MFTALPARVSTGRYHHFVPAASMEAGRNKMWTQILQSRLHVESG